MVGFWDFLEDLSIPKNQVVTLVMQMSQVATYLQKKKLDKKKMTTKMNTAKVILDKVSNESAVQLGGKKKKWHRHQKRSTMQAQKNIIRLKLSRVLCLLFKYYLGMMKSFDLGKVKHCISPREKRQKSHSFIKLFPLTTNQVSLIFHILRELWWY